MTRKYNPEHDELYDMLEKIRVAGWCNMWGASPYLYRMAGDKYSKKECDEAHLEFIDDYENIKKARGWLEYYIKKPD